MCGTDFLRPCELQLKNEGGDRLMTPGVNSVAASFTGFQRDCFVAMLFSLEERLGA